MLVTHGGVDLRVPLGQGPDFRGVAGDVQGGDPAGAHAEPRFARDGIDPDELRAGLSHQAPPVVARADVHHAADRRHFLDRRPRRDVPVRDHSRRLVGHERRVGAGSLGEAHHAEPLRVERHGGPVAGAADVEAVPLHVAEEEEGARSGESNEQRRALQRDAVEPFPRVPVPHIDRVRTHPVGHDDRCNGRGRVEGHRLRLPPGHRDPS